MTRPVLLLAEPDLRPWDPAFVDGDLNAYTVCTSWVISGQKLYLFDVFPRRLEFPELAPAILEQKKRHRADQVILEVAGVGKAIQQTLKPLQRDGRWLYSTDPKLSKTERALVQTPKIERGLVFQPIGWKPSRPKCSPFPMAVMPIRSTPWSSSSTHWTITRFATG